MEELLYDFIIDTWKIIRRSLNTSTHEEWEWVLEEVKKLDNNPKYKEVKPMSTEWLASYIGWLEERNHETKK